MGILDRLNLLVRANINDNLRGDKGAITSLESNMRDIRREHAELRQSEKHLVRQVREERDKADRWEERAILALRHGDEDLAHDALVMKNQRLKEAEKAKTELVNLRNYMRDIERGLEALEMKIEGARGRMNAQRRPNSYGNSGGRDYRGERDWDAEMRRRMQQERDNDRRDDRRDDSRDDRRDSYRDDRRDDRRDSRRDYRDDYAPSNTPTEYDSVFDTDRTFREFDRMSNQIDAMEAEISAHRELGGLDDMIDPRRRELEDIFSKMEKKKKTDDDLEDLKKKFQ